MKEAVLKTQKYFLYIVTSVQLVAAIAWTVIKSLNGEVSLMGILSTAVALLVFSFLAFGKDRLMWVVFAYLITLPMVLHTGATGHIAGLPEGPQGSIKELAVQRFSWPFVYEMSYLNDYTYPDEMDRLSLMTSPATLKSQFFDYFKGILSDSEYDELCNRVIASGLDGHKREIVTESAREMLEYMASPITLCMNMWGYPGYLAGRNMELFQRGTGFMGRLYFKFSGICLLLMIVLGIVNLFTGSVRIKWKNLPAALLTVLFISLYNIFFTTRGFNYFNSVWILILWALPALKPLRSVNEHS